MSNALIIVPPLLTVVNAPLLGPAMLAGAARVVGHHVDVLDLNAAFIGEHSDLLEEVVDSRYLGDHDRPPMRRLRDAFEAHVPANALATHDAFLAKATELRASELGRLFDDRLRRVSHPPDLIGISVMYGQQVIPAIAITSLARSIWPGARVVWGGAHVTALQGEIARDVRYALGGLIDGFSFGYAETTFVETLGCLAAGAPMPREIVAAGSGSLLQAKPDGSVVPSFDLDHRDARRLTLPSQLSRGCHYGACAFCTYPRIEGQYRELPIASVTAVIDLAVRCNAAVSFKDSLLRPDLIDRLAELIAGRVPWSVCTKLSRDLNADRLRMWKRHGLATMEVGLETTDPETQQQIGKRQPPRLFIAFLDAAQHAGISVVVNYMTGFPGANKEREERQLEAVASELTQRRGLVAKIEHNEFQLERLSPMACQPDKHDLEVVSGTPWSSILTWRFQPRLIQLGRRAPK